LRGADGEKLAHANGDQGGRGEQLRPDLEKEEREWKGGDTGLCGFKDGIDDGHRRDVEGTEREASVEIVWWGQLAVSPLWTEGLSFGIC
jgi:hypothetical protein